MNPMQSSQSAQSAANQASWAESHIAPGALHEDLGIAKDVYASPVTPERHVERLQQEEKLLSQMIEKGDPVSTRVETKATTSAGVATTQSVEKQSADRATAVMAGLSDEVIREIKKRVQGKVSAADSGSMQEVDSRRQDQADDEPQKRKKQQEFLYDLMALLVRLGLLKKT